MSERPGGTAPEGGTVSLVTTRLLEAVGVWRGSGPPSFPVERSDIRRWAIAVHWPEVPPRLYWDEEYARTTRWGGVIAPPDFNPFAWPVHPPTAEPEPYHAGSGEPGPHLLNGGQECRFGQPIRPGDVIMARQRIEGFEEKQGRFGLTLYVRIEHELTNQRGEVVSTAVDTIIRH